MLLQKIIDTIQKELNEQLVAGKPKHAVCIETKNIPKEHWETIANHFRKDGWYCSAYGLGNCRKIIECPTENDVSSTTTEK